MTVGGVYKDFPENSQIGNHIFMPFDPDQDKNDWGNWNYTCYYRLDNPANVSEVEKLAFQQLLKVAPGDLREGLKQEKDNSNFFNLAPLSEVHFSKIGNKSASSRTTVYLINTQKVLGATTGSLRRGLLAESVLISLIAFAASIVLLLILRDSGVQDLVTANLSLSKHLPLIAATFGISILIGVLAGLYPSFYVTSFPPALVLKGSFGLSPKGRKLRTILVCFQFFVAFMLIIAIGIMYTQRSTEAKRRCSRRTFPDIGRRRRSVFAIRAQFGRYLYELGTRRRRQEH